MKKAVIYARQSSGSDDFSESVENQFEQGKKLAEKEGYKVIGAFADLNTSGKTYPEGAEEIAASDVAFQRWYDGQTSSKKFRHGLKQVIDCLKDVSAVIVYDMTRLYRPVTRSFLESYVNQLFADVDILQVKGGKVRLSEYSDTLIQSLRNQINDEQIANNRAKSKEGLARRRNSGILANGGGCFGLRYDVTSKMLIEEPEKSAIVRKVFEDVAERRAYQHIIKEVNAEYVRLTGAKAFYSSNLHNMTSNPVYAGYMYDDAKNLIECRQVKKPIISLALFLEVQNIMGERKQAVKRTVKRWLPFSGLVYCGNCGAKLVSGVYRNGDKEQVFYFCKTGRDIEGNADCMKSRVNFSLEVEDLTGLKEAVTPLLILAYFREMEEAEKAKHNAERGEELKGQIALIETKKEQQLELLKEGLVSLDNVKGILEALRDEQNALRAELDTIRNFREDETREHLAKMERIFKGYALNAGDIDALHYEMLLYKTVSRIEVFGEYVRIHTVYGAFDLPRVKAGRVTGFPPVTVKLDMKHTRIVYQTGKRSILADFGKMTVETA